MAEAAMAAERTFDPAALRPTRIILFLVTGLLALMTIAPLLWMLSAAFKNPNEVFAGNLIPEAPTLRQLPVRLHPG